MSLFSCPNASRSLLSAAIRGVSSKASRTAPNPFTPSRWVSSCTTSNSQCAKNVSRSRNAAFTSPYPYQCRRTFFSDKTIKKYEDLPKDYRDQVGLPFRSLDLKDSEVLHIFGKGINSTRANLLLRILHGRRVAGTMDDPAFAIHTAQYTADQKARALEYLRKSIPVNEILNAGLRAEDELSQLESEAAASGDKNAASAKKEKEEAEKIYKPDPVYGHSKLDEIRARNVAKRKAKEAAEEEERKAAEARGEVNSGTLAEVKQQNRQIANPKVAEYYKAGQSDMKEVPEMKAWERILPSATVVALVIGFLAALSSVYEEPSAHFRLFPDISTSHATLGAVVGLNALVFLAWRVPPLWRVLNKYMIFVVATVKPVTLFSATVSHQRIGHLLLNMVPLWAVGSLLHDEIGRANFLTMYLGCGALGFLGGLITYTLRGWLTVTSLGASGATLGVISAYLWEHRMDRFKLFGLPQDGVHGIVFLALLCVPQIATFGKTMKLKLDVASHVAGIVAGILGIEYINRHKEDEKILVEFPSGRRSVVVPTPREEEVLMKEVKQ